MSKEFLMKRHSELMEAEVIAIEAFQKLEKSGVDLGMGMILFLHHAIMKPSVKFLTRSEEEKLHEYVQGWLDDCQSPVYSEER